MKTLKNLFSIIIAILAISVFSSCEKDDVVEPDLGITAEANDDSKTTTENTPVTISVLSNDKGTGNEIISVSTPSNGTAVSNSNGTITYTPNTGFTGTDSFTYTIIDDVNHSSVGNVTITVKTNDNGGGNENSAPNANNDSQTTNMNDVANIDVLSNDTDVDNDNLTITSVSNVSNGTISTDGSSVTYTPNTLFIGTETFTYTVSDGEASSTATVTITVGNSAQTETYNTLSGYFGVEMLRDDNTLSNYITFNNDGTFSEIGEGPYYQTISGTWIIKTNGDIEFETNTGVQSFEIQSYSSSNGEGFKIGTQHPYIQL